MTLAYLLAAVLEVMAGEQQPEWEPIKAPQGGLLIVLQREIQQE
jgi:hypothetical protein